MHSSILNKKTIRSLISYDSQRLVLRPMHQNDVNKILKWRRSKHILEFSFDKKIFTKDDHLKWFNHSRNSRIDYIIILKCNNKAIGSLSYKKSQIFKNAIEMGKYIGEKAYLGQGYGSEATKVWLKIGFNSFHFRKIFIVTRRDNSVNIHINEKLGFKKIENPINFDRKWLFMVKEKL